MHDFYAARRRPSRSVSLARCWGACSEFATIFRSSRTFDSTIKGGTSTLACEYQVNPSDHDLAMDDATGSTGLVVSRV